MCVIVIFLVANFIFFYYNKFSLKENVIFMDEFNYIIEPLLLEIQLFFATENFQSIIEQYYEKHFDILLHKKTISIKHQKYRKQIAIGIVFLKKNYYWVVTINNQFFYQKRYFKNSLFTFLEFILPKLETLFL